MARIRRTNSVQRTDVARETVLGIKSIRDSRTMTLCIGFVFNDTHLFSFVSSVTLRRARVLSVLPIVCVQNMSLWSCRARKPFVTGVILSHFTPALFSVWLQVYRWGIPLHRPIYADSKWSSSAIETKFPLGLRRNSHEKWTGCREPSHAQDKA